MQSNILTDLDDISRMLIDVFGLSFEQHEENLQDPLLRWLDFRLRYIDPQPRRILKSHGFDDRIPSEAIAALDAFIELANSGGDLNPFQTKNIKKNDTSGSKRQLRTDGLWADWGIHHVHLVDAVLEPGVEFSERSEWLLFFYVQADEITLIDVRSHSESGVFQAIDLVEKLILSSSRVEEFFRFRIKGRVESLRRTDASSVYELRKAGIVVPLIVDERAYMPPGQGITTAATSGRVSHIQMRVVTTAERIAEVFCEPNEPNVLLMAANEKGLEEARISLVVVPPGRLGIACLDAGVYVRFPSPPIADDARSELEHWLLPEWAGKRLAAFRK